MSLIALPNEGKVTHKINLTSQPIKREWRAHTDAGRADLAKRLIDAEVLHKNEQHSVELDKTYEQAVTNEDIFEV